MTTKRHQYSCLTTGTRVIILTQKHLVSGLGDANIYFQTDYECSMEDDCGHRARPACPIHRLNIGDDARRKSKV